MPEKKIPSWAEVYGNRPPNELETRLAEQKAGKLPTWQLGFIVSKLPASDPRRQKIVAAEQAGTPLTEEQINELFK